jgi:hypothetical protein
MKTPKTTVTHTNDVFRHTRRPGHQSSSSNTLITNQANEGRTTRVESIFSSLGRYFAISNQIRADNLIASALQREFNSEGSRLNNEQLETLNESQHDAIVIDLTEDIVTQTNATIFLDRNAATGSEAIQPLFQREYTYFRRPGWKSEDCPICCETFQQMNKNTLLDCNHRYHAACIRTWFAKDDMHKTCPLCRAGPYN